MYNSCKPIIISAINLLNTDPSFDGHINSNTHHKRSLLPFLSDGLRWLTGHATTKDVNSIKEHVYQFTETQSTQQETLVHIVSILSVTRYAAQVNRHSINILMDKVDETSQDVNNLYNLTTSLATNLSYHQLILYIRSVWHIFKTHYPTSEQFLHTPWITLMQLQQEDVGTYRRNPTIYITPTSFI